MMSLLGDVSKWKEGFTYRVVFAAIYAAIVLQPIILFSQLYSGVALVGAATYLTLVLFDQIGRLSGKPLSKQELFTLQIAAETAAGDIIFLQLLWFAFLKTGSVSKAFGIADKLPLWIAPPETSSVYLYRTILHSDWLMPIALLVLSYVFYKICNVSLGLIAAHLYVEVERLPFPLAQVSAEVIVTLAERESERVRVFSIATFIGAIYSLVLYGVPLLSEVFAGTAIRILPFPWYDMNIFIETWLPGASFGVATDILVLGTGFVIPFSVAVAQFLGAFIVYFIGNHLLVVNNLFPHWLPGMNITLTWSNSILDFWASFIIGLGIAAGIAPFIKHPEYVISAIRSLAKLSKASKEAGYLSIKVLGTLFLFGSLSLVAIALLLVPSFMPYAWVLLLLSPVWAFISTLIAARSLGLTGYNLAIPYVRETALALTPYRGVDIWFAPIYTPSNIGFVWPTGGSSWAATLKICWITETKLSSIYKAWILATACAWLAGLFYVDIFWRLAPVPSTFYPWTAVYWPVQAIYTGLWITKQIFVFNPALLLIGLFGGLALSALEYLKIPFSLIGFAFGAASPIPTSVTVLIGALLGKYFFSRVFGKEWWKKYKTVIVAGFTFGEGIIVGVTILITLIAKSVWTMPY